MKKTLKILLVALAFVAGNNTMAQTDDLFAMANTVIQGDTIKIVSGGDTTIFVTNGKQLKNICIDTVSFILKDTMQLDSILEHMTKKILIKSDTVITSSMASNILGSAMAHLFDDDDITIKMNNCDTDKTCHKSKHRSRTILNTTLGFGYGLLGMGDDMFKFGMDNDAYSLKWSSRWDIMLMINILPDNFFFPSIGIGYESDIFKFSNPQGFYDAHTDLISQVGTEKTKLVARYITLPVMLNFNFFPTHRHSLTLKAGVVGGLNFNTSHTGLKLEYENALGNNVEEYTGSNYKNFNTLKLDAMIGLEYTGFTIYYRQSMTNMFKDSKETPAYPFSFGIMFGI